MNMNIDRYVNPLSALIAGSVLFSALLIFTGFGANPFIIFAIMMFLVFPFRNSSLFLKRLIGVAVFTFSLWVLREVVFLLTPFIIAFVLAYLLDPLVSFFQRKKISRALVAFSIVFLAVSIVTAISIFIFPFIFSQLNGVIREISSLVQNITHYLDSRKFYQTLGHFGFNTESLRGTIQAEIVPRVRGAIEAIFQTLLSFLTSLSGIVTQVLNAILIPILLFYFLKDFSRLKSFIRNILVGKNDKLLNDLRRIHVIVQTYLSGQAIAATLVGILSSTVFVIFGIPYGIVLGVIAGLLNPIPYVGIFTSLAIGILTILLVEGSDIMTQIMIVTITIVVLHFIDTYFLQPKIVGKRVGLHPLLLIASLFVFGYFLGIIGLLLAVPTTATMVMFLNDWLDKKTAISARINTPADEIHS